MDVGKEEGLRQQLPAEPITLSEVSEDAIRAVLAKKPDQLTDNEKPIREVCDRRFAQVFRAGSDEGESPSGILRANAETSVLDRVLLEEMENREKKEREEIDEVIRKLRNKRRQQLYDEGLYEVIEIKDGKSVVKIYPKREKGGGESGVPARVIPSMDVYRKGILPELDQALRDNGAEQLVEDLQKKGYGVTVELRDGAVRVYANERNRRGTFRERLANRAVQKTAYKVESVIERRLGIETISVEMLEQLDRVVAALPEGSSKELLAKFEKPVEAGGRALEAVMNLLDFGWEIVRDTISEEGGKKKAVGFTPGKLPSFLTVLGIRGLGRLGEAIAKKPKGEEKIGKTAKVFERFIPEEPRKNDRRGYEEHREYYGSGRASHEEHRNGHGQEGHYRQKNDFREPRQIHYGQSKSR